jgi:hypothetical protein
VPGRAVQPAIELDDRRFAPRLASARPAGFTARLGVLLESADGVRPIVCDKRFTRGLLGGGANDDRGEDRLAAGMAECCPHTADQKPALRFRRPANPARQAPSDAGMRCEIPTVRPPFSDLRAGETALRLLRRSTRSSRVLTPRGK